MGLYLGDSLEVLRGFSDNSIDAVVTDPPYGLSFMGKKWDYDVPSVELWREVLRVLKPGGHVLSFGGTRTYHRMVVNIEDACFEIRDQIQWLYGSGFPKSMNVGKQGGPEGFGTALKPANEPICLARKPLENGLTVAQNVLKWGTGAMNIDASRIQSNGEHKKSFMPTNNEREIFGKQTPYQPTNAEGRWPANILLDAQAAFDLDEQSGQFAGSIGRANRKSAGQYNATNFKVGVITKTEIKDFGGASRFFYVAKASKRERGPDNKHPTVKPIKLMEYLVRLITPPNGTVLDPFMGSGTTGIASKNLDFQFKGIELNAEYFEIAKRRIEACIA